jgi:hypothetical protein
LVPSRVDGFIKNPASVLRLIPRPCGERQVGLIFYGSAGLDLGFLLNPHKSVFTNSAKATRHCLQRNNQETAAVSEISLDIDVFQTFDIIWTVFILILQNTDQKYFLAHYQARRR